MRKTIAYLVTILLLGCACAHGGGFKAIYPGMTKDRVVQEMGNKGPSDVVQFEDNYSAWYFDDDKCLLFKGDEVVGKSETKEKPLISFGDIGGVSKSKKAECVPPGRETAKEKIEPRINIPTGKK